MSTRQKIVPVPINPIRVLDYCDTIGVMLTGSLSYEEQSFIKEKSGSLVYKKSEKPRLARFIRYLYIHQPTRESVKRLIDVTDKQAIKVRLILVHLARDYVFDELEDSEKWGEFFKRHIVKKWHSKQQLGGYEDVTFYTSKRRDVPLNIVAYNDKRNRFTKEPNVHVEFRLYGSNKLKSVNISSLEIVYRLNQEITNFIDKNLTLLDLGKRALNRIKNKCHGLNDSYKIGDKEFTYRWLKRLMNTFKRHGIQVTIDSFSNKASEEESIIESEEESDIESKEESVIESIIESEEESDIESDIESDKKSKINIIKYLDVLKLEYELPFFMPEDNADISMSRGGLIMAGCGTFEELLKDYKQRIKRFR